MMPWRETFLRMFLSAKRYAGTCAPEHALRLDWAVVLRIVRDGMGVAWTEPGPADWGQCGRIADQMPGHGQGIFDRHRNRRTKSRAHSRHGGAIALPALRQRSRVVKVRRAAERGWSHGLNKVAFAQSLAAAIRQIASRIGGKTGKPLERRYFRVSRAANYRCRSGALALENSVEKLWINLWEETANRDRPPARHLWIRAGIACPHLRQARFPAPTHESRSLCF